MKKKIFRLFSKHHCINVSIRCCNCCKTSSDVSKCVYLACMAVKIEHTVAGHNHDILQQCNFDVHASQRMGSQAE